MPATLPSIRTTRPRWAIAGCLALTIHLCLIFGIDHWWVTEPFQTPGAAPLLIELRRLSRAAEPDTPDTESRLPATIKPPPAVEPKPPVKPSPQPTLPPDQPVAPKKAKTHSTAKPLPSPTPAPPATDIPPTEAPSSTASFTTPVTEPTPTGTPRVGIESTAQQKNNQLRWQSRLLAHLQRYKRYPTFARQRRQQGTTTIRFRIDRDGNVISSSLVQSSGHVLLDRSALEMVDRAQPLPLPPATATDEELSLTLPVQFTLR